MYDHHNLVDNRIDFTWRKKIAIAFVEIFQFKPDSGDNISLQGFFAR